MVRDARAGQVAVEQEADLRLDLGGDQPVQAERVGFRVEIAIENWPFDRVAQGSTRSHPGIGQLPTGLPAPGRPVAIADALADRESLLEAQVRVVFDHLRDRRALLLGLVQLAGQTVNSVGSEWPGSPSEYERARILL